MNKRQALKIGKQWILRQYQSCHRVLTKLRAIEKLTQIALRDLKRQQAQ